MLRLMQSIAAAMAMARADKWNTASTSMVPDEAGSQHSLRDSGVVDP